VTDAWTPQISGVVTTLTHTVEALREVGHSILTITPNEFRTFPCPSEPTLRLSFMPGRRVRRTLDEFQPEAIHIATEGPLGFAARRHCRRRGLAFTSSYCTRFPEYMKMRLWVPLRVGYAVVRRFHAPSSGVMVTTESLRRELEQRGFRNLVLWTRGVDTDLFRPRPKDFLADPRPIFMYMGRVAVEKNIEEFVSLGLPGTKCVVGDGPALEHLRAKYSAVKFTGFMQGEELAQHLAAADVFVFPSRTDTYGLVMLEALACGVPVAAHPVQGPADVIESGVTGILDEDLRRASLEALKLNPETCRRFALTRSWARCADLFLANLVPTRGS
jgi:glycosyltransferase involved in cell wall biosynthesis